MRDTLYVYDALALVPLSWLLAHPDAAAGANKLHIRSNCAVKLAVGSPAPRKMTTLSWLPEAACAVQLNEPLSSVRPSTMANLWWKA